MTDFGSFIQAEIDEIRWFQRTESMRLGRPVPRNEAAERWVDMYAEEYRRHYLELQNEREAIHDIE
jgi:hypothetical protein